MAKLLTFFFPILLFVLPASASSETRLKNEFQDCEQIVAIALGKLIPAIDKNNYEDLESLLGTIQSACGENEFTQRLRIMRALIEKKSTGAAIADYLSKNYHEKLVMRWDYSVEKEYRQIYQKNKADFDYVPLNHPVDSLIKLKALALLNSASYNLTEQEHEIALLFSDNIEAFYQSYTEPEPTDQPKPSAVENAQRRHDYKARSGFIVSAGAEFPITGSDPVFKTNPTIGVMYSSRLSSPVILEAGVKLRINSNDRSFDYLLYDEIEHVNSTVSYSIGGNLGVKVFDNDKILIIPKVGLYWDITGTGLTETQYNGDGYYDYDGTYIDNSSIRYHNVNTMRSSFALSVMRHISEKKYIGLEAAYHYIPYHWEDNLLTNIQPNYASLQLFFRF